MIIKYKTSLKGDSHKLTRYKDIKFAIPEEIKERHCLYRVSEKYWNINNVILRMDWHSNTQTYYNTIYGFMWDEDVC